MTRARSAGPPPPESADPDATPADLDAQGAAWRADVAAARRRRTWWLERQGEQEASLVGALADLAQLGRVVAITLVGGRVRTGRLWAVAPGVVGLRAVGGRDVLVAVAAIAAVRAVGDDRTAPVPVGDRDVPVPGDGSLAEALATLADDRIEVQFLDLAGVIADGAVVWVGRDVTLLRSPGGGEVHVALDAVAEVVVLRDG
jgi:hypothetical protein